MSDELPDLINSSEDPKQSKDVVLNQSPFQKIEQPQGLKDILNNNNNFEQNTPNIFKFSELVSFVFSFFPENQVEYQEKEKIFSSLRSALVEQFSSLSKNRIEDIHFSSKKESDSSTSSTMVKAKLEQEKPGRIGTNRVYLNEKESFGEYNLDESKLIMRGKSNFSSILASCCVHQGKYMYEVFIQTPGVIQIGFTTIDTFFTSEEGVGDYIDSFAFDGNRVKKWTANSTNEKYGVSWTCGDVIGCCLDLERGEISFYRNGISMGVAFSNIKRNQIGIAYFPGLSLSKGERVSLNFGATPFEYPVKGFLPFEIQPLQKDEICSSYLLNCLTKLTDFSSKRIVQSISNFSLSADELSLLSGAIFEHLGSYLEQPFFVAKKLLPILKKLAIAKKQDTLKGLIHSLSLYLEDFEFKECFLTLFEKLSENIGNTSFANALKTASKNKESIDFPLYTVFHFLLEERKIFHFFCSLKPLQLHFIFENIFYLNPTTEDLTAIIPTVWYSGLNESTIRPAFDQRIKLLSDIEKIRIEKLEYICRILPRSLLQTWLSQLIQMNRRPTLISGTGSDPSTLVSLFAALSPIIYEWTEKKDLTRFNISIFYDPNKNNYYDFARIGGLESYLKKEHPIPETIPENTPFNEELFFDSFVFIYHLAVAGTFKQAAISSQKVGQSLIIKKSSNIIETESRRFGWYKSVIFFQEFFPNLHKMINFLLDLLLELEKNENLFLRIPDFYIETILDSFHCLRRSIEPPPIQLTSDEYRYVVVKFVKFLILCFGDKKVVNPPTKDFIIQSITVLLQYNPYVRIFELPEVNPSKFLITLIKSFDIEDKIWINASNLLSRIWRGTQFYNPVGNITGASPILQNLFKEIGTKNPDLINTLLNRVLGNINHTLSEFLIVLVKSINPKSYEAAHNQKKLLVMFEVSSCLGFILELITKEMPDLVLKDELNRARIVETFVFILNRIVSGPGHKTFSEVVKTDNRISYVPLLSPICGTILNLGKYEELIPTLLNSAGFDIKVFEFLCESSWIPKEYFTVKEKEELPRIEPLKIKELEQFYEKLKKEFLLKEEKEKKNLKNAVEDDDELCPICCANEINTIFYPCKHSSCAMCIKRHLLNNTKCFFCNADVEKTVPHQHKATARLGKEFKHFINSPIQGYKIELAEEGNLFEWNIWIQGPPDTVYEGGIFKCFMNFPPDYPNSPPVMKFISEFWHPNVYPDGKVCISILHTPDPMNDQESDADCWRPIQTVESILVSVTSMLSDPNFSSPANVDSSVELRKKPEEFKKRVRKIVEKSIQDLPPNFEMPKPKPPKKPVNDEWEDIYPNDDPTDEEEDEEEEEFEYEEEE